MPTFMETADGPDLNGVRNLQVALVAGRYEGAEGVREQADAILRNPERVRIYPDARLYRSVAAVRAGERSENARAALDLAERDIGALTLLREDYARYLINSNQAVVKASIGDKASAQRYATAAAEYNPAVKPILDRRILAPCHAR